MDVSSFQTKLQNFFPLRRRKQCLSLKSLFTKCQTWTYCSSEFQSKHSVMWMPVFFNSVVPQSTSLRLSTHSTVLHLTPYLQIPYGLFAQYIPLQLFQALQYYILQKVYPQSPVCPKSHWHQFDVAVARNNKYIFGIEQELIILKYVQGTRLFTLLILGLTADLTRKPKY